MRGIESGTITLVFRRWRRPTVKPGGTLLTRIGQLHIDAVDLLDPVAITDAEARAAGAIDADAVRRSAPGGRRPHDVPHRRPPRGRRSPDRPRECVDLDAAEWADVARRLESLDARSTIGPWTRATLRIIADRPGVLAATLASELGQERAPFKQRVRRLKALGLTESLEVGYRLSPLGAAALTHLPEG